MHQQLDKKSEVLERFWTSEKKSDTRSVDLKFLKSSDLRKISEIQNFSEAQNLSQNFSEVQIFGQTIFRCSDFLSSCWCEVTQVTPNVVKLKLPKTLRIHLVVNVLHVKPYLGPLPSQPVSWPGPIQVSKEHDEEYEVDYIVASCIYRCQLQYLVHWKGYEEHEHTWEPASNVKNAPLVVEHFYKENPSAPWKLCMAQLDFDSLFKPVPENLTVCDTQFCSLESCSWGRE